jgi:hypothetical protein
MDGAGMLQRHRKRHTRGLTATAHVLAAVAACLALGCAHEGPGIESARASMSSDVCNRTESARAEKARAELLAREVERLREDIRRAEEALVSVESGLKVKNSHASAVSALAEARILVNRASRTAPWRAAEIREASDKLTEAEAQIEQNNPGSALFFVYRARRIAEMALLEARTTESDDDS